MSFSLSKRKAHLGCRPCWYGRLSHRASTCA
jgi:hypothetical protein